MKPRLKIILDPKTREPQLFDIHHNGGWLGSKRTYDQAITYLRWINA